MPSARLPVLVLLAPLACTGCIARNLHSPMDSPITAPQGWSSQAEAEDTRAPDRWWVAFGDPGLDGLIDRALDASLDLKEARARAAQASAASQIAGASAWPQLTAGAEGSRVKLPAPSGLPSSASDPKSSFGVDLKAGYEVDLWGKNEAARQAASLDAAAAAESVRAAAEIIASRLADTWFKLAEAQARLALLEEQAKTSKTYLQLVTRRFDTGLASLLAVRQQRQQLLRIDARLPLVRSEIDSLKLQLSVLAGRTPSTGVGAPTSLPAPPPMPALGVPSELLTRRADLRAARRRIEAQDRRVAAAIADRFPTLRLSVRAGLTGGTLSALVDGFLWSLGADLAAPLMDGGRRAAEVERNKARLEELLAAYGKTLLQALLEVEGALRREAGLADHIVGSERQLEAAQAVLDEARARYQRGIGEFFPVLDALRRRQEAEVSLLSARGRRISERVRLYGALGGNWTEKELAAK